mmetsp:Transcript_33564/g.76671  ORF Transcript_33564/g.76671 Transcript_33564/m.76671 type:complete len:265 (-) Transcript_33564:1698-2492(-)
MDRKMKRTLSTKRSDGPVELMQLRRNTSTSRLSKLRVPSKDFTGSSQCSASCATTPSCWSTETSNPSTIPNSSAAVVWVALEFLSMYRYKTVRQVTNSTTTATKGPPSDPAQATHAPSAPLVLPAMHSAHVTPTRPAAHVCPGNPPLQRKSSPWHLKTVSCPVLDTPSAKYPGKMATSPIPLQRMPFVQATHSSAPSMRKLKSQPQLLLLLAPTSYTHDATPLTSTISRVVKNSSDARPAPHAMHAEYPLPAVYFPTEQVVQAD